MFVGVHTCARRLKLQLTTKFFLIMEQNKGSIFIKFNVLPEKMEALIEHLLATPENLDETEVSTEIFFSK